MKRYLKYIFLSLVSAALAVSCLEELEPTPSLIQTDDITVLVPRVKSFTNQYVTKAGYSDAEDVITSLKVLAFNNDGALVHTQDMPADTRSLTLNKSMLNSPDHKGKLSNATVVMLANIDLSLLKKADGTPVQSRLTSLTLDDLANSTYYPEKNIILSSELGTGFKGFPMIGGKSVDLTPTSETNQQDPVVIDLKILFAKIEFEINVEQGSENQGEGMQFTLNSWAVNNVSRATTLAVPTNNGEPVRDFMGNIPDEENVATADEATASSEYTTTAKSGSLPETKTTTLNGTPLKFTFYMAESRYNPGTYTYPINDLHESFKQQFKPEVATSQGGSPAVGMASYVQIEGTYNDYRGTSWNVDYTIYLGKNSYDNFHVDRNSNYKNIISIKGIRDRQAGSYGEGEGDVWIDHRVNVEYNDSGADDHVTITRETLIDSHIEVRPLRVRWTNNQNGQNPYSFARIHLPYYTEDNGDTWTQRDEATAAKKNWIGIERGNKTSSLYCKDGVSKGKRRYFTSSLIKDLNTKVGDTDIETHNGVDFILLENDDCAWIYIDEYIYEDGASTIATKNRMAKIIVDFCTTSNDKLNIIKQEEYILYQQPIININKDNKTYYIENYEEYLHSYDSHDRYNIGTSPTDYTGQGMKWGFDGSKVSKSQYVVNSSAITGSWESFWEGITNPSNGNPYDFFHSKDSESEPGFTVQGNNQTAIELKDNTGLNFTYTASEQNGITISSMGEMPDNAYQYCLSKNKFTEAVEGEEHTMMIHWYLPDVYELTDIFAAGGSLLAQDSYYWSSQAGYDISSAKTYIYEDPSNARAVSVSGNEGKLRKDKHRIRCVYDRTGKEALMSSRTPEGIGGLIKIPMTVSGDGFFNYSGWFAELQKDENTKTYDEPTYKFPKNDEFEEGTDDRTNADNDFAAEWIDGVHYYSKNPLTEWGKVSWNNTTYYSIIHPDKWPGLTKNVTNAITDIKLLETLGKLFGIDALAIESSTPKTDTRIVTSRTGYKIEALPTNEELKKVSLDHNEDTKNTMTISFSNGKNTSNNPEYKYHKEDPTKAIVKTYTKYWEPPTYKEQPFESDSKTYNASARSVTNTYTDSEIREKINRDMNGVIGSIIDLDSERYTYTSHTTTPITLESEYSYTSASSAREAAETHFNTVINVNKEYKAISYDDISTPSKSIDLCSYTYIYKKEKRDWKIFWWGSWYDNGTGTGSGIFSKTLYTYVITYQKPDGTYYKYVAGTGGWGKENDPQETTGAEAALETVDALTFYAGNSFTINTNTTTDSDGKTYEHYIRSIKVNYDSSTITEGDTYLRFVAGADYLPNNNVEPAQMTYLDGDNGWSKWISESNDESVTLRLVICDKTAGGWLDWINPSFSHTDPGGNGYWSDSGWNYYRDESLVIKSLEIRLESVPL